MACGMAIPKRYHSFFARWCDRLDSSSPWYSIGVKARVRNRLPTLDEPVAHSPSTLTVESVTPKFGALLYCCACPHLPTGNHSLIALTGGELPVKSVAAAGRQATATTSTALGHQRSCCQVSEETLLIATGLMRSINQYVDGLPWQQ